MTSFADRDLAAAVDAVANGEISFSDGGHAELPPPPGDEPKVVCSFRLPVEAYQQLRQVATDRGLKPTALMRDWVLAGLASADRDRTISVADLLRVVAALPDAHPDAA